VNGASEAMSDLPHASHFTELVVWQRARALAKEIFALSQEFPEEEKFALTDQIRRSSRSIGAQIAEAWGKRRYERHFVSKLTDADAEQYETQHWLITAYDAGHLDRETIGELGQRCKAIGSMIGGMIQASAQFCQAQEAITKTIREDPPLDQFFTHPANDIT
jgi:four helix bundle protein